jgi:hypothetical protein
MEHNNNEKVSVDVIPFSSVVTTANTSPSQLQDSAESSEQNDAANLASATHQTGSTLTKAEALAEARSIVLPDRVTASGLTSNQAIHILAAFLSLPETDRRWFLALSHEELVMVFKRIARTVTGNDDGDESDESDDEME